VYLATRDNDNAEVNEACARYAQRYRQPKERDNRVAVIILVDRIMGRVTATNE
jgi:hypothetical protein